jgi:hypothetical protein
MAALLSTLLGITIFLTVLKMFGEKPTVFALALFCFDPNFLAHGSFVTTDIGAALTRLLSIFCFYPVLNLLLQAEWWTRSHARRSSPSLEFS